jgi:manganese-dependent ADP-ribose/CDP-alcohol diphosphatase
MVGVQRRWMPYNGAHGEEQLAWLGTELTAAKAAGERVVVLTHVAVCPGACHDESLSWDYDQVLKLLHDVGQGVVAAVFSGHDHKVRTLSARPQRPMCCLVLLIRAGW